MSDSSQIVPLVCLPPSGSVPQKLPHSAYTNSNSNEASWESLLSPEPTPLVEGNFSRKRIKKPNRDVWTKPNRILWTNPSDFGSFQELPAELRLNIWRYLMPENRDEPKCAREPYGSWTTKSPRHGNRLAILRTSRALKEEVGELY